MSYKELTKEKLGSLIKKPTLKDKLLEKPPFRFLHDICTSVAKETGFLEGVWTADLLNSKHKCFKDKKVKAKFLQTLITAIEVTLNTKVPVKVTSILAGKDAEATNGMLQSLADAASLVKSGAVSMTNVTEWMKNPDAPREPPKPTEVEEEVQPQPAKEPERPVERAKKQHPELSSDANIRKTQELLSLVIETPSLKEKYLKKPPLRFLIDVCAAVKKASSVLDSIPDSALDTKKMRSLKGGEKKKFQSAFLKQLIQVTGAEVLGIKVKAVLSGSEATKTNEMLQLLANLALGNEPPQRPQPRVGEETENVAAMTSESKREPKREAKKEKKREPEPKQKKKVPAKKEKEKRKPEKKPKKRQPEKQQPKTSPPKQAEKKKKKKQTPDKTEDIKKVKKLTSHKIKEDVVVDRPRNEGLPPRPPAKGSRDGQYLDPVMARQGPPRVQVKSNSSERSRSRTPQNIITDGTADDEEEEHMLGFETNVPIELSPFVGASDGQGKLVRELMGGSQERAQSAISRTSAESYQGEQQVNTMREQIQSICTSVIPLGKCIDFVFEDIERMKQDFDKYRNMYDANMKKLEEEREITQKSLMNIGKTLQQRIEEKENLVKKVNIKKAQISQSQQEMLLKLRKMIG